MRLGLKDRIQTGVEYAASALLGGAVGFAVSAVAASSLRPNQAYPCAGGAAALAFFLCIRTLKKLSLKQQQLHVASFEPQDLCQFEPDDELLLGDDDRLVDELVLTDADRVGGTEPLVLDDILAEIGPDSRVVRLFDRKAMPTPGQLQSRINSHLNNGAGASLAQDASQALSEALAELRRSLR